MVPCRKCKVELVAQKGKAFKKILEDLENAGKGYNLTVHKYKFEDYGNTSSKTQNNYSGYKKSA